MTEEFLWYIWKFRLFDNSDLKTTDGEAIHINKPGVYNTDSGPDFFNARIKVGRTLWAGNVEVHTHASDWHKHKHSSDKTYDNIILHVVYEADTILKRKSGAIIPTLELKSRIPKHVYEKYMQFKSSKDWIPCEKQIGSVDPFVLNTWLDRLLAERLERKAQPILDSLRQNKNNWEETFYQTLARSFGQKVNSDPFESLARIVPANILKKHLNDPIQIEALLFGGAGMLEKEFVDNYPKQLQKEFRFLKQKFKLRPMDPSLWKFMRLHPPNFPTIRISQFANLIYKSSHLFSKILDTKSLQQMITLLSSESSEYWKDHFRFDKQTPFSLRRGVACLPVRQGGEAKGKQIGVGFLQTIVINTIVPFLFIYGKEKGDEKLCEQSLSILEKLEPESNSIITKWNSIGVSAQTAYETQALLQLKNEYCLKKRCLECRIGGALLK